MLLAFSAKPEDLDILMLSLTFGNVEVQKYVLGFADCFSLCEPHACHSGIPLCLLHNHDTPESLEANRIKSMQLFEKCRYTLLLHREGASVA
jgi:hypothetical protein